MNVKIRKLSPDVVIPAYACDGDSGFDLVSVADVIIAPGETALVPTGLAFEIPDGYELQIRPRSGVSLKTKLRVANSPGTVDASYRGEVCVIVDNIMPPHTHAFDSAVSVDGSGWVDLDKNVTIGSYIIRKGDRIAQGVIAPVSRAEFTVVDELSETERGTGGFGSTGVTGQ